MELMIQHFKEHIISMIVINTTDNVLIICSSTNTTYIPFDSVMPISMDTGSGSVNIAYKVIDNPPLYVKLHNPSVSLNTINNYIYKCM